MLPGGGSEPPSRDDLRRLEARIDSRLQEINARLVLHDGRFAAMGDRINQADRRSDALSARVDARLGAIDRRFDAVDTRFDLLDARLDDWRNEAAQMIQEHRAAGARLALTALLVGALFNLALVVGLYAALA